MVMLDDLEQVCRDSAKTGSRNEKKALVNRTIMMDNQAVKIRNVYFFFQFVPDNGHWSLRIDCVGGICACKAIRCV